MTQPTAIYAVHRAAHPGSSIESQIEACELFCALKLGVTATVFVDREISSGSNLGSLPLVEFCQANRGALVLVKNTRVLTRMTHSQYLGLMKDLSDAGAQLWDTDGQDYFATREVMKALNPAALAVTQAKPRANQSKMK